MNMSSIRLHTSQVQKGFLILLGCGALFILACYPAITSFSPERGKVGTEVTITGKRFGATADENTVRFSGLQAADVQVPREDTIVARVPQGAKTGLISVSTRNGFGESEKDFIVEEQAK
jgi:hypothetical protein